MRVAATTGRAYAFTAGAAVVDPLSLTGSLESAQ